MEKYIVVLLIIMITAFSFAAFPVFFKEPTKLYVVSTQASPFCVHGEQWEAKSFFVNRLYENNVAYARSFPRSRTIAEYYINDENNIESGTPLIQRLCDNGFSIYGVPYVID